MLSRWMRLVSLRSMAGLQKELVGNRTTYLGRRVYSKALERAVPLDKNNDTFLKDRHRADFDLDGARSSYQVTGSMAFLSKPCSLALAPDSKLRVEEPKFDGIRRFMLKLLMFYSSQSKAIRGANVLYQRIVSQVDKTDIYNTFNLEKCFRTTFALLVLHMWLCLVRLKVEGKEGVEFGQYLYEIYNHDVELRVSAAGVNLLLTRWMKDLEKIFYGNVAAYDAAMLPEASKDELSRVIWRNVFSDEDAPMPSGSAAAAVQALARYTRREYACLALTASQHDPHYKEGKLVFKDDKNEKGGNLKTSSKSYIQTSFNESLSSPLGVLFLLPFDSLKPVHNLMVYPSAPLQPYSGRTDLQI